MALRSEEGMNLSPVELAVPMSEQTPITAGHGLDLLGPVVIEGSPGALQTVAMPPEPFTSQVVSDITVADIETDELMDTLNATIVSTPAMHLAPPPVTSTDPIYRDQSLRDPPPYRDHTASSRHPASSSSDPSLLYFLPLYLVVVYYANSVFFLFKGSSKCGFSTLLSCSGFIICTLFASCIFI